MDVVGAVILRVAEDTIRPRRLAGVRYLVCAVRRLWHRHKHQRIGGIRSTSRIF